MLLARQEVAQDLLPLGVANLLQDHLLRRLRADAAEVDRLQRFLEIVAHLDLRILGLGFRQRHLLLLVEEVGISHDFPTTKGFEVAGLAVDCDPHVGIVMDTLLGRRRQRQFERAKDDVPGHVLFARQHIDQQQDLAAHFLITS
ncbi:MAG: hypothetical protein FAZ92_03280 [Accumulibacter sp.]|nr:MAG: hypothetical protein FAZ92_03280 [Accumulibacter sp.]